MTRPRQLTPKQSAEVKLLRHDGVPTRVLAKEFGVSQDVIQRTLRKPIVQSIKAVPRKLSPADVAEVMRQRDLHVPGKRDGLSTRDLAERFGVSESTIRKYVGEAGPSVPRGQVARDRQERMRAENRQPGTILEVPIFHRDYRSHDRIKVYPMGDFHIGSPSHDEPKLDEWLDYIYNTPDATILNTGDNINAAIIGSKSQIYTELMTPEEGIELVEAKFRPLAVVGRLDAIGEGNHEARIYRIVGINPMAAVAKHLGVDHWSGAAFVVYHVGAEEYTFYVRHGTGNAPASLSSITKASNITEGVDVFVTGHTHRQSVVLEDTFYLDQGAVARRPIRYVTAGSFIRYERYAAERGYAPSHLGAPRIFLDGRRHDVHVSI